MVPVLSSGQLILCDDLVADLQYLGCGLGIQCCGMFIQQKELGLLQCCHKQCDGLTLTTG